MIKIEKTVDDLIRTGSHFIGRGPTPSDAQLDLVRNMISQRAEMVKDLRTLDQAIKQLHPEYDGSST